MKRQQEKLQQNTLRCGNNAHVVQQYRRLKPNIGFFLEKKKKKTTHTFDRTSRIKGNSSVAGDCLIDRVPCEVGFFVCLFACLFVFFWRRGGGSAPWVLGTPDLWGDTVESTQKNRNRRGSEWQHNSAESRVVSTYKHVGKAFKTELPQQTKRLGKKRRRFNVQSGQHNAREECTVEIRLLSPFDMKTELQDSLVIPLSSQITTTKHWETSKRMRQFKKKKHNICTRL